MNLIEYVDCVYDKHMNLKRSEITGEFLTNCDLEGYPTMTIFFNIPQEFEDYSLHKCALESDISLKREKLIEFVPPNGVATILGYT